MKAKLIEKEAGGIRTAYVETKKKKSLITMCSAVAEKSVMDSGNKVYVICEWMDQNPDEIYFEVTDESLYDFLTYKRDDIEVMDEIRDDIIEEFYTMEEALSSRFKEAADELYDSMKVILEENGAETDDKKW